MYDYIVYMFIYYINNLVVNFYIMKILFIVQVFGKFLVDYNYQERKLLV